MSVLKSLPDLTRLNVFNPLTDPSTSFQTIAPLSESITDLAVLDYGQHNSGLSEADIATLLKFQRLHSLRLTGHWENGSPTDEHLQQIAKFPDLKELSLYFDVAYRRYTQDGIDAFRQARPDVELHIDGKDFPAVTAADAAIDYAAERKAAEWLARVPGMQYVHLRMEDGSLVRLGPDQRNVPEGNFSVEAIHLFDESIDDACLARLADCRRLTHVTLGDSRLVTIVGLQHLRQSRSLAWLVLGSSTVDDQIWSALSHWPRLQHFDFVGNSHISDQGLAAIPRLPGLTGLGIRNTPITDAGLEILADRCPNLTGILLTTFDDQTDRTLIPLSRFLHLKTVYCSPDQITEAGVAVLAQHPQVSTLVIDGPSSDATFERLMPLQGRLKSFELAMNAVTKSPPTSLAYERLAAFTKLEEVHLHGVQGSPTDADLLLLAKLPLLKSLRLDFPEASTDPEFPDARRQYTPAGIDAFRQARPDVELKIDGKDYPAVTATDLLPIDYAAERKAAEWLARVPGMQLVHLRMEDGSLATLQPDQRKVPEGNFSVEGIHHDDESIDDVGLFHLANCRRLTCVTLGDSRLVTNAGLQHLRQSRSLTILVLCNSKVDNPIWSSLSHWPKLQKFQFVGNYHISDQGLAALPRLPGLTELGIRDTPITDAGLEILADRCPNLTWFFLSRGDDQIDRTLLPLSRFLHLKTVHCSPNQLTDAGVAVLAQHPQITNLGIYGPSSDVTFERLMPLQGQLKSFEMNMIVLTKSPPTSLAYERLAAFTKLEDIHLHGFQGSPTDADLLLLGKLPQLKSLSLQFPEKSSHPEFPDARRLYTPAGIDAFRKARPDVQMKVDDQDYPAQPKP